MKTLLTNLFYSDGDEPQRGSLLLEGDRIERILAPDEAVQERDIETIKLSDALVTPGLIDMHTHLLLSGESSPMSYERQLLQEPLSFRALRGAHNAKQMLDFGFTTVRDVCTEGAAFADVSLRDAIKAGFIKGPRIYPSGPGLGITGGYIPSGLAPGVCIPMGCAIVDGVDAIRKEVRSQIANGVSWIKVFADWPCGAVEHGHPSQVRATFLREELLALVDEATRRGRRIAAHATSDEGARLAIECGAASIEHMGELSDETLSLMKARDLVLVPTLSVMREMLDGAKPENKEAAQRHYDKVAKAFERALRSGVTIACGTDIGCYPFEKGSLQELTLMRDLGMKPLDALRAATRNAAKLLGRDDLGVIQEGAIADLCVFASSDFFTGGSIKENQAPSGLPRPVMVFQSGERIR